MAVLGWAVLTLLSALAALNALGVALRTEPSGRAEAAVVASAAFFAQIAAPVFVLGYASALTKTSVGLGALALFSAIFGLLSRGRSVRAHVTACAALAWTMARLPWNAVREAIRLRSLVTVGLLYVAWILAACFVLTVFVPNESWDGFLYHEPIMGFAIQNHGFAIVELPMVQAVQAINGYPHLGECLGLWFVIFTDKTLIELPNDLAAPAMMLVAYALARRYTDRLTAVGWACVLVLMPQAWAQLCQTYIDIVVGFYALFAIYFATRPVYRLRDAWLATLGLALFIGSKGSALVLVPPIAVVAVARLLWIHGRARRLASLVTAVSGAALIGAVGATALVRNWRTFKNPVWPVTYDIPRLGIHWSGLQPLDEQVVDKPLRELWEIAHGVPVGGMDDVILHGYGYAIIWVVLPLGCAAMLVGLVAAFLEVFRRRPRSIASNLALVIGLVVVGAITTPTVAGQNARFSLYLVGGLMAAASWLLAGRPWMRAREGVIAASIVLSIIPLYWMRGRGWYWVSTEHLEDVASHPLKSRMYLERPAFDLLAKVRVDDLGPGDTVVFDGDVGFVGALWNFEFSNRVQYVSSSSRKEFLKTVDQIAPKWVAVGASGDARKALEATKRWEYIGEITPGSGAVFRHLSPHA